VIGRLAQANSWIDALALCRNSGHQAPIDLLMQELNHFAYHISVLSIDMGTRSANSYQL
jgi:hypothetical protein